VPIQIDASVRTIEGVHVTLALRDVAFGDLAVELISPSGTRSVLLNAFTNLPHERTSVREWTLTSYAFNDEAAQGEWKLRFVDVASRGNLEPAKFVSARLQVLGH